MIHDRRSAEKREERYDLFSSLLDANEGLAENGEQLADEGLLGNVFIFMVAGYEVSQGAWAHSLVSYVLTRHGNVKTHTIHPPLSASFPIV